MKSASVYAMDTAFTTPHTFYPLDLRCELTAEAGYDATYLTMWGHEPARSVCLAELAQLREVPARHGLSVAAVYTSTPSRNAEPEVGRRVLREMIDALPDGCELELHVGAVEGLALSDAAGDSEFLRFLEPVLDHAAARGTRIALYPHVDAWVERFGDAVRLARQADHPALRATFCGFHWYARDTRHGLLARLREAAPWLAAANFCGSRPTGGAYPTLEPLDLGTLDNFHLYGALRAAGFHGRVGVQGYSVGGDVLENLKRSRACFKRWDDTLARHPDWPERICVLP